MMIASHVKAVLSRATPFNLQDFRNVFHLFDSWQLGPQRFGVVEKRKRGQASLTGIAAVDAAAVGIILDLVCNVFCHQKEDQLNQRDTEHTELHCQL